MDLEKHNFDTTTKEHIRTWLSPSFDVKTRETLQTMLQTNPEALIDAFYTRLSFGTGGMRGLMGLGANRLNNYTISFATQGLANYLKKAFPSQTISVFIGYDTREHSSTFAEVAATVLAGNGIEVYLSEQLCPTPFTSYSCRHYHAQAAIMITASHNPAEYNGYKVYWQDGGQVLPPHDEGIMQEMQSITSPKDVHQTIFPSPLIHVVYEAPKEAYLKDLSSLQLYKDLCKKKGNTLSIVYTNLHGTGLPFVLPLLKRFGFENVHIVEKQATFDGRFPTAPFPNPELDQTLTYGLEKLEEENADLLIATDPDADRMRVVCKQQNQIYKFNGNQIAALLLEHLLSTHKKLGTLKNNCAVVKTIVTTELLHKMAARYGVHLEDVLTGFKYISQWIETWSENNEHTYLFGGEESYGTLVGTFARDKDAVIASCMIAEMALVAKEEGKTLVDRLDELYSTYGVFGEALHTMSFPETKEGRDLMEITMQQARKTPLQVIAKQAVTHFGDYLTGEKLCLKTKQKESLHLPPSNVLRYYLEDGSKLIIRPSGTEPKIKIYAEATLSHTQDILSSLSEAETCCQEMIKDFLEQTSQATTISTGLR